MKANVKRPARFSFKTITEKKAKHLTLIFVAVLFLVIVVLALFPLLDREEERYEVTTYAMGSYVQQTVYGENREDAAVKAADAVEALEQKISWRVENSDIQKLNNNAGKDWVTLSDETLNILTQAQSVSEKSGGAFDVTIAPISRLWDFDDELNEVPDSDLITSLLPYVNHSLLRIDETEQTASLKNLGMAVDLGSVGKGAACDAAVRAYEEAGAKAAIIAVGGSVGVYGEKSSGKPWSVAVRDPNGDGSLGSVTLAEGFVSTSGSYEKYFEQDGVLYHHLLDPKTGYPAESGLVSVTVVAKSGVLSDALSTACFVLGREDGMKLLEEFDAEGIFHQFGQQHHGDGRTERPLYTYKPRLHACFLKEGLRWKSENFHGKKRSCSFWCSLWRQACISMPKRARRGQRPSLSRMAKCTAALCWPI